MKDNQDNLIAYVWYETLNRLKSLYSPASYQTWIAPIVPSAEDNQLILNCPNEFAKEWLESRYKKDIIKTVQSIEPTILEITIRVGNVNNNEDSNFEMNNYQELMKQIHGKTIDHILANKNSSSGFDIVFTDGSVLELYATNLSWAFEEDPDER